MNRLVSSDYREVWAIWTPVKLFLHSAAPEVRYMRFKPYLIGNMSTSMFCILAYIADYALFNPRGEHLHALTMDVIPSTAAQRWKRIRTYYMNPRRSAHLYMKRELAKP